MREYLLNLALLAICLFQIQAQLSAEFILEEEQLFPNEEALIIVIENLENNAQTSSTPLTPELAIPVTVNLTLPGDQAAVNLRDSASRLTQVGGRVAIRNEDGTASIVPAIGLANILLSRAGPIGNLGSNIQIEMPNGGKVPFIYIGPNDEENTTQETSFTPRTTTVSPAVAPDPPSFGLTSAAQAAANSNLIASNLEGVVAYLITTNPDGTPQLVNAQDIVQEALNQANVLSAVSEFNYNVVVADQGDFKFEGIRGIDGFVPVYGIVLSYNGSVAVIRQEQDLPPTLTFVNFTVMPPRQKNTIVPADVAVSNLWDSVSKLNKIDGYVALKNSTGDVNVVEASKLASDLTSQANDYSKLGTIPVMTFDDGKVLFEPIARVEGILTIDAFIISNTRPKFVTLVQLTDYCEVHQNCTQPRPL